MYRKILYERASGVARITLNRPDKRNALDPELLAELRAALAQAAVDDAVAIVLLSGAGQDFCAGADLETLQQTTQSGVLANLADARQLADLFLAMRNLPRPIVAAVKGRALAGGCGLATACDIVLSAESAQFGYPEVNIGFVPAMVMALLRRSVSEKAAFELVATGRVVDASRARELGLVHHVFADAVFDTETETYVASLAAKPRSAVALSKELLYHMDAQPFAQALASGAHMNAIARMTEDCRSGVEAFLNRPKGDRR